MQFKNITSPKNIAFALHNMKQSKLYSAYAHQDTTALLATMSQLPRVTNSSVRDQFAGTFNLAAMEAYRPLFIRPQRAKRALIHPTVRVICTYAVKHVRSGKAYVGSTENFFGRWSKHVYDLRRNEHTNSGLQALYDRDGLEAFEISILHSYDTTQGLEMRERADGFEAFDVDDMLNFRLGHDMLHGWYPLINTGRWGAPKPRKRAPWKISKPRWFDNTSNRV